MSLGQWKFDHGGEGGLPTLSSKGQQSVFMDLKLVFGGPRAVDQG